MFVSHGLPEEVVCLSWSSGGGCLPLVSSGGGCLPLVSSGGGRLPLVFLWKRLFASHGLP